MNEKQVNPETGEIIEPNRAVLFAKLARVMGSLKRLPKSGHNAHFNYDYVTDADVSDSVRNALAAEGVAFLVSMRNVQMADKKTIVTFSFTFACGETGATWSCDWQGEAMDTQDKGTAKAATSALKYFLLKNFILSTGDPADDTDAAGETKAKATRAEKPKAQPEPALKPEPAHVGGNGKPATGLPVSPADLLAYANQHREESFDNLYELRAALTKAGLEGNGWAKANDLEWWKHAKTLAIGYKKAA